MKSQNKSTAPDQLHKQMKIQFNQSITLQDQSAEEVSQEATNLFNKLNELKHVIIVQGNMNRDSIKVNPKSIVLLESELVDKIDSLNQMGLKNLDNLDLCEALLQFKQCDIILEVCEQKDISISWKKQIICKLNLGVCYQRIGLLEESFNKIDDTITLIKKQKKKQQNIESSDQFYFFMKRLTVQCLLQCCIILSELGKHYEGLEFAKLSLRKMIQLVVKIFIFFFEAYCRNSHNTPDLIQSLIMTREILSKFGSLGPPILKAKLIKNIQRVFLHPKYIEIQKLQVELKLNGKDMIENKNSKCNILQFLQLKPLYADEINVSNSNDYELQLTSFIEKICLLTVSFYCVSTEARFLEGPDKSLNDVRESENYLSHALEISYVFLPYDMPLVAQIISVHNKFHGLARQIIYEDIEKINKKGIMEDYDLILLKPLQSLQKQIPFVPLIRKFKKKKNFYQPPPIAENMLPNATSPVEKIKEHVRDMPTIQNYQELKSSKREQLMTNNIDLASQQFQNSARVKSAGKKLQTQNNPSNTNVTQQQQQLMDIYMQPNKPTAPKFQSQSEQKRNLLQSQQQFFPKSKQNISIAPVHYMNEFVLNQPQTNTNQKKSKQPTFFNNIASPQSISNQLHQNFFKDGNQKRNFNIQISNNFNIMINSNVQQSEIRRPQIIGKPSQIYHPMNQQISQTAQTEQVRPLNMLNEKFFTNPKSKVQFLKRKRSISMRNQSTKETDRLNVSNVEISQVIEGL